MPWAQTARVSSLAAPVLCSSKKGLWNYLQLQIHEAKSQQGCSRIGLWRCPSKQNKQGHWLIKLEIQQLCHKPRQLEHPAAQHQRSALRKKAFEIVCNYLYGNLTKPRDGHDILHSQKKRKWNFRWFLTMTPQAL